MLWNESGDEVKLEEYIKSPRGGSSNKDSADNNRNNGRAFIRVHMEKIGGFITHKKIKCQVRHYIRPGIGL